MRALLAVLPLLLCFSAPARAAVPPCGEYRPDDEYAPLLSFAGNSVSARDRQGFVSTSAWRYRIDGDTLLMRHADSPLLDVYRIEADGERLVLQPDRMRSQALTYRRSAPAVCVPTLGAGVANAPQGTPEAEQDRLACAAGDIQACVGELAYDRETPDDQRAKRLEAYCRQDASPYACEEWAKALAPKDPNAPLYLFRTAAVSAPELAALRAGCREARSAKACTALAEQDWIAGRYASARDTLVAACEWRLDAQACEHAQGLKVIALSDAPARRKPQQPCGTYASGAGGLFDVFRFGDDRAVAASSDGEATMRYRLREDQVLVRHDKGDDFVLRWLGDDTLVGMDDWTRFTVYLRGMPETCAAVPLPIASDRIIETPYRVDHCALAAGASVEACCASGSMSACMGAGHTAALGGDWARAAGYYDRVCAMHVREGCGNVVEAYHNSGDDQLLAGIRKVCHDEPRSVACEELDLASAATITRKQLERDVEQSLRELLERVPAEAQEEAQDDSGD
ncbi:hypothetical protein [Lysobacter sp. cf310]|uniref:hypothetical protein n=1 Tax=Lysobacter sp. cf310 TaxID=1761790 RepID=UPI0008F38246|nr:hypothetical protein [Lysobacter sp. cf310]SFL13754.1 hypothetical protein SAMN04487938_3408 [Lysobacter sp. cf310]